VSFDEVNLVPNAGLLPAAVLSERLGLAGLIDGRLLLAAGPGLPHSQLLHRRLPRALPVAGDVFDFAIDDDTLTLAVVDATASRGTGRHGSSGSSTPLLSTLAVTALRNARRAGLPLGEQAALASDLIY